MPVIAAASAPPPPVPQAIVSGGTHTVSGAQTVGSGHCVIGNVTGPGPPATAACFSQLQTVGGQAVLSGQIVFGQPVMGNVGHAAPPPLASSSSPHFGQTVGIGGHRVGSGGQTVL